MRQTATILFLLSVLVRAAAAAPATPVIEGPITGNGTPVAITTFFDLADVGYQQAEFFISGTVTSYAAAGTFASDGKWPATPSGTTAPYKTRILVYRPIDPKKFNGIVFVEWINVSGGLDTAPDWITAHTELVREGFAWVGVSAQFLGVEGGGSILNIGDLSLKKVNPARYGTLSHPGDSFSYDMFSQAGEVVRHPPPNVDPLGGLKLKKMIGAGESQSAFRLVTYINAIHPLDEEYDGYLVHSRGGGGFLLSQTPQAVVPVPAPAFIRDDLKVPVLIFQTETDLVTLGYFPDRQPDTKRIRLWEVAGTAHADTYTLGVGLSDKGDSPAAANVLVTTSPIPGIIECGEPVNSGPQHWVLNAAVSALGRWVKNGKQPPRAPRLEITAGAPPTFSLDAHGNVLGGIRTPWVDVPVATLSGLGNAGGGFCFIFGTTVPFDAATLASLYPDHATYVRAIKKSVGRAVRKGFIRKADAKLINAAAEQSSIGN